jgi:deoxyribonuclease V
MRVRGLHKWRVTPREAREIQLELRKLWEGEDRLGTIEGMTAERSIRTVAGLDAAFVLKGSQALKRGVRWRAMREANRAIGGAVVYRFPEMEEVERAHAIVPLRFPYVPGLLSFREVPVLLAALEKLERMPDLLFCDGQGYAHPRRFGLACHLGVTLDRAAIGCAKSILIGSHGALSEKAGSWTEMRDGEETIGAAVRTREGVKPVYVSQGHRVSLETAIRLTLAACDGTRIPKPTRAADRYVREVKKSLAAK